MSYATLRFAHLGWRVIRVEGTPVAGRHSKGDPNRYIGRPVGGEDRHSYYVAPNVGKESVVLNLKEEAGRDLLRRIVRELNADVFCTNTLPAHHKKLGFDYETLRGERDDLIWCCISAMGLDHPDVPGYDPMIQALCGYMDLTGQPDGPPLQCGPPIIDLKAGDEAFTQVLLALMERAEGGGGKQIDISMARLAVSWLHTFLPMLDMDSPPAELKRSGNEHRQFIPVNAYRTRDGYIYVAIGSDAQWHRFVEQPMFQNLDEPRYKSNEGRRTHKRDLHAAIEDVTNRNESDAVARTLAAGAIPHAPITPIEEVMDLPFVKQSLLTTVAPDGRVVRLPPPAVPTAFLDRSGGEMTFAPSYGGQTEQVLGEAGLQSAEIEALRRDGVVA